MAALGDEPSLHLNDKDLIDQQKMAKHKKEDGKHNKIELWWKTNAMPMAVVVFIKHLDRQGRAM